jgi:hypothetical protein
MSVQTGNCFGEDLISVLRNKVGKETDETGQFGERGGSESRQEGVMKGPSALAGIQY